MIEHNKDDMIEDARLMSRYQFVELYGNEHAPVWREQNPHMGDIKFMTAGDYMGIAEDK